MIISFGGDENSAMRMLIFLVHFFLLTVTRASSAQNGCSPVKCGDAGPAIRFPFRLKGRQPERCGYPGLDLSCTGDNKTEFQFQFPLRATSDNLVIPVSTKALIQAIDYSSQTVRLSGFTSTCLPKHPPTITSPPSPFTVVDGYPYGFTLFNCSSNGTYIYSSGELTCLNGPGFAVHAYRSYYSVSEFPSGCTMMYNISDVPNGLLFGLQQYSRDEVNLHWSEPDCRSCEDDGMYCQPKSSGNKGEIHCISINKGTIL